MEIPPDFDYADAKPKVHLDHIHRAAGDTDIYFVANPRNAFADANARFA